MLERCSFQILMWCGSFHSNILHQQGGTARWREASQCAAWPAMWHRWAATRPFDCNALWHLDVLSWRRKIITIWWWLQFERGKLHEKSKKTWAAESFHEGKTILVVGMRTINVQSFPWVIDGIAEHCNAANTVNLCKEMLVLQCRWCHGKNHSARRIL